MRQPIRRMRSRLHSWLRFEQRKHHFPSEARRERSTKVDPIPYALCLSVYFRQRFGSIAPLPKTEGKAPPLTVPFWIASTWDRSSCRLEALHTTAQRKVVEPDRAPPLSKNSLILARYKVNF